MLRNFVFGIGCLLLIGALVAAGRHQGGLSFELVVFGLILAGGVAFERWRYKSVEKDRPGANWQPTGERFIDPATGKSMEVYFDAATGERHYVEAKRRRE